MFRILSKKARGGKMNITIPFKSCWKGKMLSGRKTCTTRTKRYGREGDIFEAFGEKFVITNVINAYPLGLAIFLFAYEDGFESPDKMKKFWIKLHPRKGFDPQQEVWVHWFERIDE